MGISPVVRRMVASRYGEPLGRHLENGGLAAMATSIDAQLYLLYLWSYSEDRQGSGLRSCIFTLDRSASTLIHCSRSLEGVEVQEMDEGLSPLPRAEQVCCAM